MTGPLVRTATVGDLGAIHRFAQDVIHDTYDALVDPAYASALIDTWWTPDALGPDVAEGRVLIAAIDDAVVGLAHRGEWRDEPVMWKLYLAGTYRNGGLGLRLVDELIASLPAGTSRLRTEHIVANRRAGRFYDREGFAIDDVEGPADDPTATVWRSKPVHHDWADLVTGMERAAAVNERSARSIAMALSLEQARSIIDVGCGVGSMTVALAKHFADALVVAADTEPAMRCATRRRLTANELLGRVEVTSADIDHLAERHPPADLVWAAFVVHHQPDQEATLRMLREAVAPGGRLALAEGGLPPRMLPWDIGIGRPGLEVRLDAAQDAWFRSMRDDLRGNVRATVGWPSLLRRAGFSKVSSKSFLTDTPASLDEAAVGTVVDRLRFAAERLVPAGLLDRDDVATVVALLDEDGADFVGRRDDTYILSAETVHIAHR